MGARVTARDGRRGRLARVVLGCGLAIALGGPAEARFAGGGPVSTDCFAEFEGITATRKRLVECVDGDPACDRDGACDGSCEFLVQLCVNQCNSTLPIERVKANVKGAVLEMPTLPTSDAACGEFSSIVVETRGKKKPRPGKRKIRLTAFGERRLKLDKDKAILVCRPRTDACPPLPETKDDVVADLPALSVDPPAPAGETEATVVVDVPGATDISLTAEGEGCGAFSTHATSASPLVVSGAVGALGSCGLSADVTTAEGVQTLSASFEVTPRDLQLPAAQVAGAVFYGGDLPPASGTPTDPTIAAIDAPGSLINGGSAQLRLTLGNPSGAADVRHVRVQVMGAGGHRGYWEAPAMLTGEEVTVSVTLDGGFTSATAGSLVGPIDLVVQLVDRFGTVGGSMSRSFDVVEVESGDVQVSLSWNTPTDVDLHVVEPGGEEIYFGNRSSATGGMLDLDSNPACSIDGVNNENVTWSDAPPPGEYVVRVNFWSDCGGLDADYTVTTRVCGRVETFTGSFAPGAGTGGGEGSGTEIVRFTTDCTARARGKATYEDLAQTTTGLATTATKLPIRFAKVEVRRAADDSTLATGATRQDGTFDLRFRNDGTPGYYVLVSAEQDDAMVRQRVASHAGTVYTARSAGVVDESVEPDKAGVSVEALQAATGPAFNVFDVGVKGATLVKRVHGAAPPLLEWFWTSGRRGTCSGKVSCYFTGKRTISVLSIAADRDEYDDLVLLHEYGHFYQDTYSRSDSPGGSHSSSSRVDPRLAWGEGSATYFGNLAAGTSLYLDTIATGVGVRVDLESLGAKVPLGTSDGNVGGNLSEALVAGVLWDLSDAMNETGDTLARRDAVFAALAYLRGAKFADRGPVGADLVDVLDGWFCLGNGDAGDAGTGVRGNSVGIHQFNYDFPALMSCR